MTVERLAVAVLLCAGLDATGTGAEESVGPLSVAVPPSGKVSATSERQPAVAPVQKATREAPAAPEMSGEGGASMLEEEYVPLDLPAEEGADSAGDEPADEQVSAVEPVVLGLDEKPSAVSYFVHAKILDIPNGDGVVSASLCTQKNFTKSGCRTERVAAREGQISVTFGGVPPGTYAVQVHHDQNGNGKMDFSFFGLPKEPYGFSRDAKPILAPPKFKAASFEVVDSDVSLVIHLQNT